MNVVLTVPLWALGATHVIAFLVGMAAMLCVSELYVRYETRRMRRERLDENE